MIEIDRIYIGGISSCIMDGKEQMTISFTCTITDNSVRALFDSKKKYQKLKKELAKTVVKAFIEY